MPDSDPTASPGRSGQGTVAVLLVALALLATFGGCTVSRSATVSEAPSARSAAPGASTLCLAGPALAVSVTGVTSATPTWGSGVLRASGSTFTTADTEAATYTAVQTLCRSSSTSLTCTTSGCTGSDVITVGWVSSTHLAVTGLTTVQLPDVSGPCESSDTWRYYWTATSVSDTVGHTVGRLSSPVYATYC